MHSEKRKLQANFGEVRYTLIRLNPIAFNSKYTKYKPTERARKSETLLHPIVQVA